MTDTGPTSVALPTPSIPDRVPQTSRRTTSRLPAPRTILDMKPSALVLMDGRQHDINDADLDELATSIRVCGQINPIQVRIVTDEPLAPRHEIIAGRRRWRACALNHQDVRAEVYDNCSDADAYAIRTAENYQRQEPSAYDIAYALRDMRNRNAWSIPTLAAENGMSATSVKKYLRLLNASDPVVSLIETGKLTLRVAVALVAVEDKLGEAKVRRLLPKVRAGDLGVAQLTRLLDAPRGKKRRTTVDVSQRYARFLTSARRTLAKDAAAAEQLRRVRDELTTLLGDSPTHV